MNAKLKLLYDNIQKCNEQGLYYAAIESKNYLINSDGEILSEGFASGIYFENGYATVKNANSVGLLGKDGEMVLPCIYESVECRYGMLAAVDEKSAGIIYSKDREVISSYVGVESIKIPVADRAIICYKNLAGALIDLESKSIIKSGDAIVHLPMNFYQVSRQNRIEIIDKHARLIYGGDL